MTCPVRSESMRNAVAPPEASIVGADWPDLLAEFDRWGEAGRSAPIWWRDDDAATATPALARLRCIAGHTPLALAVIPALATPDLAGALDDIQSIKVLQHGWRHANRATEGKKSEYPSGVPASVVTAEVRAGRERLAALFGKRALPVFVPPWNRIAPELLPVLAETGIAAVSTFASPSKPEHPAIMPAGLARTDTHVDLTDWKGGKRFIGRAVALGALVFWLQRCRLRVMEADRAIGILTHHLIMDCETAVFLDRLVTAIAGHPAARWVDTAELLR